MSETSIYSTIIQQTPIPTTCVAVATPVIYGPMLTKITNPASVALTIT